MAKEFYTLVNCECKAKVWVDDHQVDIEYCSTHAAAPELLEACKYTLENLQHYQTHNQIFITAMEGIKQAIAKAEGGK